MDVRLIGPDGVARRRPDEIEELLDGPGVIWIDVQYWDAETAAFLTKRLGLHRAALHDCAHRNPVPKVYPYDDQTFVVLHAPEPGRGGHVHFVELDQYIGPNWLITVHGPMNPAVPLEAAYVETSTVARRLDRGSLRPTRTGDLSAAFVDVLVGRLREYLTTLTEEVWRLEEQVTGGHIGDPEQFLEELFSVRHGLLAVHTMAATSREVHGRMAQLAVFGGEGTPRLHDLEDQFGRVAATADGQRAYLQGVIEFYQTRMSTKMAVAGERLAVVAAVTLPITALSSIVGMNVIVNETTHADWLTALLAIMMAMSSVMLVWARRQGWW